MALLKNNSFHLSLKDLRRGSTAVGVALGLASVIVALWSEVAFAQAAAPGAAEAPSVNKPAPSAKKVLEGSAKPNFEPSAKQTPKLSVKVPVELEWEDVPGAQVYELEFQNLSGEKQTTFQSKSRIFKFKMKVGRYKVRSRVADDRKVFGAWSDLTEFTVEPKMPFVSDKSVRTNGKINPKTLTSEVIYHWGTSVGAESFKLTIYDSEGKVFHEEITDKYHYKAELPVGEFTATITALGADGVESQPVTLANKVAIASVRLRAPEIIFEKDSTLPLKDETPVARWKVGGKALVSGTLEYRYFFGEEWLPVQNFTAVSNKEVVLEAAKKPGRYRLSLWSEHPGLLKSAPASYEFVVKPKVY